MSKFLQRLMVIMAVMVLPLAMQAQQLPNAGFEDWSGDKFDGEIQPKSWYASNVEQLSFKFNFAHREAGHSGNYSMMVQDQDVGAANITETSPGYFSLGKPWVYLESITKISEATAGTAGAISWKYRPDSMVVWIKRTGSNTDKEDFYLLYYAWSGTATGDKYKNKKGGCTSVTKTDEESDVRLELNGNECGTIQKVTQIAEGMWREKKTYGSWTRMSVPIYYFNNDVPNKMNIIFSASNYPNFRANSGLYAGNSLYVDDVEMVYSSKIQKLYIGGKEWKGFDPNSTDVQTYSLGESATAIPDITGRRGVGSLTNARGKTVAFTGRDLTESEMTIVKGDLESNPTTITVKSEDGKSTTVYKIQFQRAPSTNATLAEVQINGEILNSFRPGQTKYDVELPYGTTKAPVVTYTQAEDAQTVKVTQATSPTGTATIVVTAADKKTKKTYTFNFSVGKLKDVTLQDIKVNGKSIPGFSPSQAVYKVSLPTTTTAVPTVEAVSAYPKGEQTIEITMPTFAQIQAGNGQAQIRVTAPGATTEKVYKLNFKIEASSYALLADLQIVGEQIASVNPSKDDQPTVIAFDPELKNYFVDLKMGSATLPKILYTPGDEFQTIRVDSSKVSNGNGTATVNVVAGNQMDQSVYKILFTTPQSENTNLANLLINGQPIGEFDPSITFSPDQTTYEITLGVGVDFPTVTPVYGDEYQTSTPPVVRTSGTTSTTSITVIAGNGATKTYIVIFHSQSYTDNRLQNLVVEGYALQNKAGESMAFDPEVKEYWIKLAKGTTKLPKITPTLRSTEFQTMKETYPTNAAGDTIIGNYKVDVKPLNGTGRTYTIRFSVEVSTNAALKMLYLVRGDTFDLPGFDPDKLNYDYMLEPTDKDMLPVLWAKGDESQKVDTTRQKMTKKIAVTAGDGVTKRTYSVRFKYPASNNTFLKNILLVYGTDTSKLDGFRKDSLEYTHALKATTCPQIIPVAETGQKVTVTAPYADGTATIHVMSEDGSETTIYTIEFTKAIVPSIQLDMIYINGVQIPGFDKAQPHYTATYTGALPTITYLPADANAKVQWKHTSTETIAYVRVTDGEDEAAYDIAFTEIISTNTALLGIYADDVLIDGFAADKYDYAYELPAGAPFPALSYKTAEDAQVVFFGQLANGKWGLTVKAASNEDAAEYTVTYTHAMFDDATLEDLSVAGDLFTYDPAVTTYGPFDIDEGIALPEVTAVGKSDKNQKVIVTTVNDHEQQVLVMAEDGVHSTTYIIQYTRVKSSIAMLKKLYIDGKEMLGFRPDSFYYKIELPLGTTVVPNVFPVGQLDNQVITTTFGKPNASTIILVEAQNGIDSQTYTIDFTVGVSTNTKLKSLTIDGDEKDVNETEYVFNVPFGTTDPYDVTFEKAEDGQLIQYIDAPITGVTKIIVTAENGDSRTYSIRYAIAQPEGENKVNKVSYTYTDKEGNSVDGSLVPVKGDNIVDLPFGATSFVVTDVEKSYKDQSIVLFNGEIRRGAKIIAVANRQGVNDVTYTVTPRLPEFDAEGKLQSLKYKVGDEFVDVPNFHPNVYNYMINVTAQPTVEDIQAVAYDSKSVDFSAFDAKKKQVTLTVDGGETYSICWYYAADGNPFDFSADWQHATYNGYKPNSNWTIPGDCANDLSWGIGAIKMYYQTGSEVMSSGSNGVLLQTIHGSSLSGSVPGMMTTGSMTLKLKDTGGSSSSVTESASKGITFRNTPDSLAFWRKELACGSVKKWSFRVRMSDGSSLGTATEFSGSYSDIGSVAKYECKPFVLHSNPGVRLTATINACHTENANELNKGLGGTIYTSALQLTDIHFVYNSKLTDATVNGNPTDMSGNVFTYTLGENENIIGLPALKFEGEVHDQTQVIEWLNNGEWINGELTARVINYGENSKDSTHYFVILKRTAVDSKNYTADFGSFDTEVKADTTFVKLPFATTKLPEMTITPDNIHQRFAVNKEGDAVTVIVTNELNESDTMVYVFREERSVATAPANIVAKNKKDEVVPFDKTFDPAELDYTIDGEVMPLIEVTKVGNQTIDLKNTEAGATIKVTAEDGVSTATYTITLNKPVVVTNGQIEVFKVDDEEWTELGKDKEFWEAAKPASPVLFTRSYDSDAVVFIQTQDSMEWDVTGTESHAYVLKYPTTPSSNDKLAQVLVAGVPMVDFVPENSNVPYIVNTDTTLIITPVAAEEVQTVASEASVIEGGVKYTITVTAEDMTKRTYTVQVIHPLSSLTTLEGIFLDGTLIEGFDPEQTDYTVTLPIAKGPKKAHVKMPNITYVAGDKGQKIEVTAGELNGDATVISVTNEVGNDSKEYNVTINEELSSCTELTGITVNGNSIGDPFEPGRHFYSTAVEKDMYTIDYTCDDRFFQNVEIIKGVVKPGHEYSDTIRVTAEDGTVADYVVEIYVENQSNDAQLANILLDNMDFLSYKDYLSTIQEDIKNPQLKAFDPGQNKYDINAPYDKIPSVSAKLKMEGQKVEINMVSDEAALSHKVYLTVTAVDGVTTNTYEIAFQGKRPQNANLSMIKIKNDTIKPFDPNDLVYTYDMPIGETRPKVHDIDFDTEDPEISKETVVVNVDSMDIQSGRVRIKVTAQDPSVTKEYTVSFRLTQDTVRMLELMEQNFLGNRDTLPGFKPTKFDYDIELPIGTKLTEFPEITYGDDRYPDDGKYPTIQVVRDTVDSIYMERKHKTLVTAENGTSHEYNITYRIPKSDNSKLQSIEFSIDSGINWKMISGFEAEKEEYYQLFTTEEADSLKGDLPLIRFTPGDEYQDTLVTALPDTMSGKTLGWKHLIRVTAASGSNRTYTIHYPVELSTDTTLLTIKYGNKGVLPGFDGETFTYRIQINADEEIPNLIPIKKYEAQKYELDSLAGQDTVRFFVWAENTAYRSTYTIAFERVLSTNFLLKNIELFDKLHDGKKFGEDVFTFDPETFDYTIVLPYDSLNRDSLPDYKIELGDPKQDTIVKVDREKNIITINVIRPNGEDGDQPYVLAFQFTRNNDAALNDLYFVRNYTDTVRFDFKSNQMDYAYKHPFGSDSSLFYLKEEIRFILSDTLATAKVEEQEDGSFTVTVTAQDGKSQNVYSIVQSIAEDPENRLRMIVLDGDSLKGFSPDTTFYVYTLMNGAQAIPTEIEAIPMSENIQDISITRNPVGDTTLIFCTAQNGEDRVYKILFRATSINDGFPATENDVFIRRRGMQLFVSTIRRNVAFALYDRNGRLLYKNEVPTADPNSYEAAIDAWKRDILLDVDDKAYPNAGLWIDVNPQQLYFYTFSTADFKRKIKSGKMIITPMK